MMKSIFACIANLVVTLSSFAAGVDEQTTALGIHNDSGPTVRARALLEHQRNERKNVARSATSVDIGDVAVLIDNGSMVVPARPANLVDLSNRSFTFEPVNRGFRIEAVALSPDPDTGPALPLGDDSAVQIALPFAFPFFGTTHTSLFLNSDGNVTFGSGDTDVTPRDAVRFLTGPPRIAPLLMDFDVTAGGSISAGLRSDRAVFTWRDVPEFDTDNLHTLQLVLHSTGRIDLIYGALGSATPFSNAVVGVTAGNGTTSLDEIDFAALRSRTQQSAATFEEFRAGRPKFVDIVQVAREFYRTHPDHFDMLVMFTNFESTLLTTAVAFHAPIQNHTRGLGLPDFDFSPLLGSTGEIESFVHMNDVRRYWPDATKLLDPPIDMFAFPGGASTFLPPGDERLSRRARRMGTIPGESVWTLGLFSPISLLAHETLHRWTAYVPIVHPQTGIGPDSLDLLGRQFNHWSFFFNTRVPASQFAGDPRASSMEGNAYRDFGSNVFGDCPAGQTRFRTDENELVDGFSELDQYLMGVRHAGEVGAFWYVDNPTRPFIGDSFEDVRVFPPIDDVGVCGNRVNLTLADIQSFPGVGPRVPAIGDEDDDGLGNDVKTQAFILLVEANSGGYTDSVRQVDTFRRVFHEYVNGPATAGRGKFDTILHPLVH